MLFERLFDNKGEGRVFALPALAQRHSRRTFPNMMQTVALLGIVAAALFYGDAILTPAISVISAVEGISVATPQFEHWIIPITLSILVSLFLIQRYGTAKVGKLFGPITLIWFISLAALGIVSILQNPEVLKALNPCYALQFTLAHPVAAFVLLSAIFLPLTGGLIFILLSTWKKGSELVIEERRKINMTWRKFVSEVYPSIPPIPGTAIYLSSSAGLVPSRLFYNLKHYKVLHEQLIFLYVDNEEIPYVPEEERLKVVGVVELGTQVRL